MRCLRIEQAELARWQEELVALEQRSVYPLGEDSFRLSHGGDYFAFFARMGRVHYYGLEEDGRLLAVGCGVLRENPRRWYLADLKVHPDHRRRHLPLRLLRGAFFQNYLRCGRGYGIAMNPADGRVPPAVRLLRHFPWLPPSLLRTDQLDIYAADHSRTAQALPLLAGRGPAHLASLLGKKELMLTSTGAPLPLLHVRFGAPVDDVVFPEPQPQHTHMWCLPRASSLTPVLAEAGFVPTASATIVHHRMAGFDWSSVDTSEI